MCEKIYIYDTKHHRHTTEILSEFIKLYSTSSLPYLIYPCSKTDILIILVDSKFGF